MTIVELYSGPGSTYTDDGVKELRNTNGVVLAIEDDFPIKLPQRRKQSHSSIDQRSSVYDGANQRTWLLIYVG